MRKLPERQIADASLLIVEMAIWLLFGAAVFHVMAGRDDAGRPVVYLEHHAPVVSAPRRREPPCPKGQRLTELTFSHGIIVAGKCEAGEVNAR